MRLYDFTTHSPPGKQRGVDMRYLLSRYTEGWLTVYGDGEVYATGIRRPGKRWLLHSQAGSTVEVDEALIDETFSDGGYATLRELEALFAAGDAMS